MAQSPSQAAPTGLHNLKSPNLSENAASLVLGQLPGPIPYKMAFPVPRPYLSVAASSSCPKDSPSSWRAVSKSILAFTSQS